MFLCEQASLTYSDGLFTQQQSVIERAPYEKELPAGREKGRKNENNDDKERICITK